METVSLEALSAVGLILSTLANVAGTQQIQTKPADVNHPHIRSLPAGAFAPPFAPAGFSFDRIEFSTRNGPRP